MRPDMNKVIVERARRGSDMKYHDWRAKFRRDIEYLPNNQSMTKIYGWQRKDKSENLAPIFGFLRKSVGKNWDDIYSIICKTFNRNKVINQHILDHVDQYVCTKGLYFIDGKYYTIPKYRLAHERTYENINNSHFSFYVDVNGILRQTKPKKVVYPKNNPIIQDRVIDGVKFQEMQLRHFRQEHLGNYKYRDWYEHEHIATYGARNFKNIRGLWYELLGYVESLAVVKQRQLGRAELKKFGLKNNQ